MTVDMVTGEIVDPGDMDATNDPVSVITRIQERGQRPRIREERVALRAMTADDFRAFATEERRRAGQDFAARNDTCSAAEWVAQQMTLARTRSFATWADTQPV